MHHLLNKVLADFMQNNHLSGDQKVLRQSLDGELFPEFLVEHVSREWGDVMLSQLNPDICLQVDSGLAYCGCSAPSSYLRQYVYMYHGSDDFDHETLSQVVRIFNWAGDDNTVWETLTLLELERDCGLQRKDYLSQLKELADRWEAFSGDFRSELWPPSEMRA